MPVNSAMSGSVPAIGSTICEPVTGASTSLAPAHRPTPVTATSIVAATTACTVVTVSQRQRTTPRTSRLSSRPAASSCRVAPTRQQTKAAKGSAMNTVT